jgi:serine/threonine protein kinase
MPMTAATSKLLPPRYVVTSRLAHGGMGTVYLAEDTTLGRPVAIKLLSESLALDEEARKRLLREAQAAARMSGAPHTVTVYDVGEWREQPYIVMEYLPGGSVDDVVRRDGPQPSERVLGWLAEAADALDQAHAAGVVHRDVKPANLLLDEAGSVHVADFGIATGTGLEVLTLTGTILGTAGYLAPEQAKGDGATAASDRYALGVVGFELLTGERPFRRDSLAAEAAAHVQEEVPAASSRNRRLPPAVDGVFAKALAKRPDERFPSCAAFVDALREALASPAAASATAITVPLARSAARRWSPRLVAAMVLVLLLAGGAAASLLTQPSHVVAVQTGTVTVRTPAPTSTVTVTQPVSATTSAPSPPTGPDSLIQQAESQMQGGDFQAALPLLQQAVQQLQGSGTPSEAQADLDLATTLEQLGSCDSVVQLLDRAQQIQGQATEIDQLRAVCNGPPGHQPGHGKRHGKGNNGDGNG